MQTWLITGASSGIGRHVAEKLLQRGDRVVTMVRRPEALDDLVEQYGARLHVAVLDLADVPTIRPRVEAVFQAVDHIDSVLSNAGFGLFGGAEEVSDDQIATQITTNLTGSIQFVRACLPFLRQQGGGRLMQTTSEGGQTVYPGFGIYHATKWGMEGFMETVAAEVAPFAIEVTIVEPGPTRTSFSNNAVRADALPAYDATPLGEVRRALASGSFSINSDAGRCADAIIACANASNPPRRLILGSTAYTNIERSLAERLDAVRSQKEAAAKVDASDTA